MVENSSIRQKFKANKSGVSKYDGLLILVLLCVILSGFIWVLVFYADKPDKDDIAKRRMALQQDSQEEKPVRVVRNIVTSVEAVPLQNGTLKVSFTTVKPALCELYVGYNAVNPKYRKVSGYAHEMRHTLTARDLLPGQVYFVITGSLKDGSKFREAARTSQISAEIKAPDVTDGATKLTAAGDAATAVVTGTSDSQSGPVDSQTGEGQLITSEIAAQAGETVSAYDVPLPPASPDTPLGKRALHASIIHRKFGPDSLVSMKKDELEKHIAVLHEEFGKYQDARGARELADAYYQYKDYRKALEFATLGTKLDAKDIESHKIRLQVYTKFAMGWKVKETQKKILELAAPAERAALEKKFLANEKLYGDYKTRGTPQVISIK
jgi:hypothetical protein